MLTAQLNEYLTKIKDYDIMECSNRETVEISRN